MSYRIALAAALIAGVSAFGSLSRSEEPPPTRQQVEQLQKQLAEMQKEMDALRAALRESEARGVANPAMHRHMQGMQHHWQMMHDQSCMMAPGTCAHMGAQPTTRP